MLCHFQILLAVTVFRFPLLLMTLAVLSNVAILFGFADAFVMIRLR